MSKKLNNPHAGSILYSEFMEPLGLTKYALAKAIEEAPTAITDIVNGKRGISTKIGLKLSKFFNMSDEFFIRLQQTYEVMESKRTLRKELASIRTIDTSKFVENRV